MNKLLIQVGSIDALLPLKTGHRLFMMSVYYPNSVQNFSNGIEQGYLVHFIALGAQPIDFVCFSVFLSTAEAKAENIIRPLENIKAKYMEESQGMTLIECWLHGMSLPSTRDAYLLKGSELRMEVPHE